MDYLHSLNQKQKEAVLSTEGPVLIVAGAGAGKTKTLTHRIYHLVRQGVAPESILAITFTNKAAKEMRERVTALMTQNGVTGSGRRGMPVVSTFHALGVLIIKENAPLLGLPRHWNIFDTADSKKALKEAMTHLGIDPKEHLDTVRHIISREKNRGVSASEYAEKDAYDYASEVAKKAWHRYEEILSRDKALDFDDLLSKTLRLFTSHPEVLAGYRKRFQYIHIDEYQDTNKVQNELVELLAGEHMNICAVGDTDQNIYSWRGAEIRHMIRFEKTYPEARTIFLEQNYRSTKTILGAANDVIVKNNFRIPKTLFTENGAGDKIGLFEARNEMDEAHFIALTSQELIAKGTPAEEIAVLYRANFQSRALEEAFLAYGLPYQLLGTKFFERKEVKDVLSLVKASLNPESMADVARIINIPPRGIGKVTLDRIRAGGAEGLSASVQAKLNAFWNMLAEFRTILLSRKPSESLKHIITRSGMEKMYDTGLDEDAERLENIMELATLATEYDDMAPEDGVEKFLSDSALASDQDALDAPKSGVRLMTVHASKGLEFDTVFVSGMEADLFPHTRWGDDKKSGEEGEEERRLFYVAMTRAKRKLFLTYAETRTIFGSIEVNAPSEFLADIGDEYMETVTYDGTTKEKPLISITF